MDETRQVIIIKAEHTNYSVQRVLNNHNTMSIKDLKEYLGRFDDNDDTPIVLSFDNSHTYRYGPLEPSDIKEMEFDKERHTL